MARCDLTLPSENTAKLTLGGLFTVTAGTPASCTTVKEADELIAVSFAGTAAAAASAAATDVPGGGAPDESPPPQPAMASATRVAVPHRINELFTFLLLFSPDEAGTPTETCRFSSVIARCNSLATTIYTLGGA